MNNNKIYEYGWLWVYRSDTKWSWECPKCKGLSPFRGNYCPTCGEEMRTKDQNEIVIKMLREVCS